MIAACKKLVDTALASTQTNFLYDKLYCINQHFKYNYAFSYRLNPLEIATYEQNRHYT